MPGGKFCIGKGTDHFKVAELTVVSTMVSSGGGSGITEKKKEHNIYQMGTDLPRIGICPDP
jgi:hypothetical protein